MSNYRDNIITVRFDKELLKRYTGFDVEDPDSYFKAHPRAKNPPFEAIWKKSRNGLIPSINTFLNVTDRRIQNTWEQHLRGYCEYCMQAQGIKHDYIGQCIVLAIQFKPTRSKADVNNIYTKPFLDAMVERELIEEDNYTILRVHMEYALVDKANPRSEIRIYPITEDCNLSQVLKIATEDIMALEETYGV